MPLFLLQGCIYQTVDSLDIFSSEKVCSEHGGVGCILSDFLGRVNTKCYDGTYFYDDSLNKVRDSVLMEALKGE